MAARVTQPSCSCARINKGITADCWRPLGYLSIAFFAHSVFSLLNAKAGGWRLSSARRRTDINDQPHQTRYQASREPPKYRPACGHDTENPWPEDARSQEHVA